MKKFLAVVLAVIMLCSMSVFAFAAETEVTLDKATPSGDVIIKTSTDDVSGKDAKRYSISIPADTVIPWDTDATSLEYSVEAHLGHNEFVKVEVKGSDATGAYKMTYAPDATAKYELPYTLSGETAFTADHPVVYPAATKNISVDISAEDWKAAVVGEYSDILTFTTSVA